jgi:hypothetical protein
VSRPSADLSPGSPSSSPSSYAAPCVRGYGPLDGDLQLSVHEGCRQCGPHPGGCLSLLDAVEIDAESRSAFQRRVIIELRVSGSPSDVACVESRRFTTPLPLTSRPLVGRLHYWSRSFFAKSAPCWCSYPVHTFRLRRARIR